MVVLIGEHDHCQPRLRPEQAEIPIVGVRRPRILGMVDQRRGKTLADRLQPLQQVVASPYSWVLLHQCSRAWSGAVDDTRARGIDWKEPAIFPTLRAPAARCPASA